MIVTAVLAVLAFLVFGFGTGQWGWACIAFVSLPVTFVIYTVDDRIEHELHSVDDVYTDLKKLSRWKRRSR